MRTRIVNSNDMFLAQKSCIFATRNASALRFCHRAENTPDRFICVTVVVCNSSITYKTFYQIFGNKSYVITADKIYNEVDLKFRS